MLALSELTDKADCVLPIENQSLLDICRTILKATDIAKGSGLTVVLLLVNVSHNHKIMIKVPSSFIIEHDSTLYVGLQLKQNGRPYKAMVRTVSKSRKEAFLKLQKVSSLHFYD